MTDLVAQNSKAPFPFPILVSFPCAPNKPPPYILISRKTHLDTNRNIRKHPHPDFRPLHALDLPLNHLLRHRKLFRTQPTSIAFYSDSVVAKGEGCSFHGTAGGDGDDAFVAFYVFYAAGCELGAMANSMKCWRWRWRCPEVWKEGLERRERGSGTEDG